MPKLHWLCVARKLKRFLRMVPLLFFPAVSPTLGQPLCEGCVRCASETRVLFLSRRLHLNFIGLSQISFLEGDRQPVTQLYFFKCTPAQNQVFPRVQKPPVQYIQLILINNKGFHLLAEVPGYHVGLGDFICLHYRRKFTSQGELENGYPSIGQ